MSASSLTPYIDPAGTGSVDIINRGTGGDEHRTYTDYEIIATPITGYRVERIEWTYTYEDLWNGGIKTESSWTAYSFFTFREDHNTDDFYHYGNYTLTSVSAYFVQGAPPPVTYRVTLDAQGGVGGTAYVDATVGSPMPSAVMPTKEGYTFSGYFTGTNGSGTKYYNADGSSARDWDLTSATTLHAYWTGATTYTITTAVSPAGAGSVTGGGQYISGTTVTLQALPNAGYGVAYWQKDGVMVQGSERQSSLSITVTSNATYTAALQTETKVTVTLVATDFGLVHFKDDSTAPSQGPIIKTFTKGSVYSDTFTVEAITKNGSVFKYWTISGLFGKWYDAELYRYAPDEDTTITAYFALPIEAYARQFDNNLIPAGDPCPNGEVRIMAGSETTDWGRHVYLEITEAIEVTVEQRSTGGGWSLVYFKTIDMANGQVITSFGSVWRNYPYRDHGYIVNALFSRAPTNLLVNSSNLGSPVQLVYDPATNKLVADY